MHNHYENLLSLLKGLKSVLVAFSGGVDSSLLLAASRDALGESVLAVTAKSPLIPDEDLLRAQEIAAWLRARWMTVEAHDLEDPFFRDNPPDRCYACKRKLFSALLQLAEREGLSHVIEGTHAGDLGDYRPGLRALTEMGIQSPFVEVGIDKSEIRQLAKDRGLKNWDQPSAACLASRIPYGEPITREKLHRVSQCEQLLHGLGFTQVRVRDHGALARIELSPAELKRALEEQNLSAIVCGCKESGYAYVTLDLQGYRTGAMNETLTDGEKNEASRESI